MENIDVYMDDGSSPSDLQQTNAQEARKQTVERCIQSFVHACQCREADRRLPSCQKMKRVVSHSKLCQDARCPIPFCPKIKIKIKRETLRRRLQLLRRRMEIMNGRRMGPSTISSSLPVYHQVFVSGGSKSMSPSSMISLVSSMDSLVIKNRGIGGTQTPPANVLQVVKQVNVNATM